MACLPSGSISRMMKRGRLPIRPTTSPISTHTGGALGMRRIVRCWAFLTPLKATRPQGRTRYPRAWLGAASGAGGAALTDAAFGGLIDTSELARSFQGKRHASEAAALPRRGPRWRAAHAHWQSVEPNRAR